MGLCVSTSIRSISIACPVSLFGGSCSAFKSGSANFGFRDPISVEMFALLLRYGPHVERHFRNAESIQKSLCHKIRAGIVNWLSAPTHSPFYNESAAGLGIDS